MPKLIGREKMVREQIVVPIEMADALRGYSETTALSKCEIIRYALTEFLRREVGYEVPTKAL